ncbi:39S ribosomal protein L18, mitochondrial isoform X2 [Trichosurus vulpecula]|uniref:39S ribosomal protein L18, mitochondrial isoform X2 n=1 Tax=Trichosurus vulpecula TaxID=9337 RepID=UPI00186B3D41|nr:39S ribosomal protein L18, mitochondrial isoform X2 [Trichosurus vulpecula]
MALQARGRNLLALCRKPGFRLAPLITSPNPAAAPEGDTKENEAIAPEFTNRNPRNLERLALARKERGWGTVWPPRAYWHRLRVQRTQHHIEAFVEHHDGNVVVSASTREATTECHERRWGGATGTPKNL